ncbi:inverse autotransporter beta domain-containing protein [Escherichia coli]
MARNQFGTAKTQLSVDSDFSLKGSSLDVLLPFTTPRRTCCLPSSGCGMTTGRFTTNAGLWPPLLHG